jgi:hypothetical protein
MSTASNSVRAYISVLHPVTLTVLSAVVHYCFYTSWIFPRSPTTYQFNIILWPPLRPRRRRHVLKHFIPSKPCPYHPFTFHIIQCCREPRYLRFGDRSQTHDGNKSRFRAFGSKFVFPILCKWRIWLVCSSSQPHFLYSVTPQALLCNTTCLTL